ncbi:MAG: Ig-like domain-containing protein [Lachnospiraceae bacterium]|nr:Ig-like domain-containing protein [Lachnospiraceae bacterium]
MKKKIIRFFAVVLAALMVLAAVSPQKSNAAIIFSGSCGDHATWRVSGFTLYIEGTGATTDYVLPGVVPWGIQEFQDSVTKIVVTEGITSIGSYSFCNFDRVTEVVLPDSLTELRDRVFWFCSSIKEIEIPGNVKAFGTGTFHGCTALEDITLQSGINSAWWNCFTDCSSLKSITIPLTVTSFGNNAFSGCTGLTNDDANVYYEGSEVDWDNITDYGGNEDIYNCPNIHFNSYIDPLTGKGRKADMLSVMVWENHNESHLVTNDYCLSEGAAVVGNISSETTNSGGNAVIKWTDGNVTVSKQGYVSRTYDKGKLKNSTDFYLQKVSSDHPVISGLWMSDFDILNEEYLMKPGNTKSYTLTTEIDWGNSSEKSVILQQGSKSFEINNGSITFSFYNAFDISKPIYIIATDANNNISKKLLKVRQADLMPEKLSGLSFGFGDKLSFTFPDGQGVIFGGAKFNVGFYSPVKMNLTFQDDKFVATFGVQYDASIDEDGNVERKKIQKISSFLKDSIDGAKEDWAHYQQLYSRMKQWGVKNLVCEWQTGIDYGGSIVGYLEGYIEPGGNPIYTDSGLILTGEGGIDWTLPFELGPVPMFFETSLSGEINVPLKLQVENSKVLPNGGLNTEIALSGGVGVGVKKVVSLSGGLKGKFNMDWDLNWGETDLFKLKTSLYFYLKLQALFCDVYSNEFGPIAEKVWYEYPPGSFPAKSSEVLADMDIYNAQAYKPQDLSVINRVSVPASITGGSFSENSYSDACPQIVSFSDGTRLAAWIGRNENIEGYDALCLYTSYYDGSQWLDPVAVDNDGLMDGMPNLTLINDTSYLLWMNASSSVNNVTTLDDLTAKMDVSLAVFDKDNQTFDITRITDSNQRLDIQPVVCGDENTQYVVWLTNTENDWFGINTNNEIHCRSYSDGQWGEETILYSDLNMIESMDADYDGSELKVAYTLDVDNDPSTLEDMEVYINGERFTHNDVCDSGLNYFAHDLYYVQDGWLMQNSTKLREIGSDSYVMVENDNDLHVLYTVNDGLASSVYALSRNAVSNEFGWPTLVLESEKGIMSFDAAIEGDNILIFANEADIAADGISYADSSLVLHEEDSHYDICVEDIIYDPYENTLGETMDFTAIVKNTGSKRIESFRVIMEDSQGEVLMDSIVAQYDYVKSQEEAFATTYSLPGEEEYIYFKYPVINEILDDNVTVRILPADAEDANPEDNEMVLDLGYQNLGIQNIGWGKTADGNTVIYADIYNDSYQASDYVMVGLYKGSKDDEAYGYKFPGSIEPFGIEHVSFYPGDVQDGDVYYITLEEMPEDTVSSDNYDYVVINYPDAGSDEVTGISLSETEITIPPESTYALTAFIEPETAADQSVIWTSSDESVATVDANGVITAHQIGTAVITAETTDGGYQATCTVYVKRVVTGIELDRAGETIEMEVGDSIYLNASALPSDATNRNIIWTSSDESIVSVTAYGGIRARNAGTATITATTEEGGFSASCEVIVNGIAVTGIEMDKAGQTITLGLGKNLWLNANVIPEDASSQSIKWSSSDPSVVSVTNYGYIEGNALGTVVITATTEAGGYQASCTVNVVEYVPVEEVVIEEPDEVLDLCIGDTTQYHAHVLPENATYQDISWSSWDEDGATVDENGFVTAGKKTGWVGIEASSSDTYDSDYRFINVLFRDVTNSAKYWYKPVYWAAEAGITNGYVTASDVGTARYGTFGAEENCTREQMITFLWRAAGKPNPKSSTKNPFSDVAKGAYYYKAVLWAYEKGITKGYSSGPYKGKFGVGLTVTREDTVTFLYRLAKIELDEWDTKVTDYDRELYGNFTDLKGKEKKYYYDPIVWAAMYGITKGYSSGPNAGKFGVGFNVLRKDIVTFIYRYDDWFK